MTSPLRPAQLDWSQDSPVAEDFGDVYFSRDGGADETAHVFLEQNDLPARFSACTPDDAFTIVETGFGTGLNWLTTQALWHRESRTGSNQGWLHFVSVEKFPLRIEDLIRAQAMWPAFQEYATALQDQYPVLVPGFHRLVFPQWRSTLTLFLGDVADFITRVSTRVDAWFLDGFAPDRNPAMWTDSLYQGMAGLSHSATTFATFTAAGHVRRGLQASGFHVKKVAGFGRKREMLRGRFSDAAKPEARNPEARRPEPRKPWLARPRVRHAEKMAVVIGAGIAGTATAARLAMRGWSVTVLDASDAPATGASGNPAAILYPKLAPPSQADDHFPQQAWLFTLAELSRIPPDISGWHPCGVLQLLTGNQQRDAEKLHDHPWLSAGESAEASSGVPQLAYAVDASAASQKAGIPLTHDALWHPHAGWLNANVWCRYLLDHPGIRLVTNTHVRALAPTDSGWRLSDAEGKTLIDTPVVILANGLGARQWPVSDFLPLQAVRGQISSVPASPLSGKLDTVLCHDGYISPPLADGTHCIGATYVPGDESQDVTATDHEKNRTTLHKYLPAIADSMKATDAWTGRTSLRCQSPDYLPMVGPLADLSQFEQDYAGLIHGRVQHYLELTTRKGLYANLAQGSKGFTQALLCAEILAAELNGEPSPVSRDNLDALHPMRFAARDLKRKK